MTTNEIIAARDTALKIVSDMADNALKTATFHVVFEHLLSAAPSSRPYAAPRAHTDVLPAVADISTPTGRILALKGEGVFSQPRGIGEVQAELRKHGWHYAVERLSSPLLRLVQQRQLRRDRVSDNGKKIWKYVNV